MIHLIRNAMRYASWKDRKAIATALRPIYTATTVEAAEQALEAFATSPVGRRCPAAVDAWRRAWNEFVPFLDLPAAIRRVVYTTNAMVILSSWPEHVCDLGVCVVDGVLDVMV